ncbi:ABC transporter permease [Rhodohalobacter sp. 614A]|uniref:ABC transporter permease n=1 Tax=Rhodohalobacter sp. 614A TaxID=2908649 RepID=UPI001F23A31E|nr:ABC transporter permease [Rhodohalobacter sp. 614A]
MLKHTLKLIYRNFIRFKSSFFINLIGLSTGLACALLIFLWVNDELSMDAFHENDSRLYQVMEHQQHTGNIRVTDSTPGLLAETLKSEMPEVEYAATATPTDWFSGITVSVDENRIKANGKFVGQDFFKIFSYKLIQGDKEQVLSDINSIVLSEDLAKRLFGSAENAVGKAVEWQKAQQFQVSGIFENPPSNSSDQFDYVLAYDLLKNMYAGLMGWENSGPETLVLLQEGADVEEFNQKIKNYISTKIENAENRTLFTRHYSDAYLYGNYENGVQTGGRIEYVRLFSIVAIFIIFIACINFMNLSTAKASRRMKEVGVKKAIGAHRGSLIFQYLGESLLMVTLSMILSIVMVELFLPQFNIIAGKQLSLSLNSTLILSLCGGTLVTGLIAGSYPALYLSGFKPISVLKGKLERSTGEMWARKGLVVFQFAVSIVLIIAVLVVYKQTAFVQSKNLGYEKEHVLFFNVEGRVAENRETFLYQIENIPGIMAASTISERGVLGGGNTVNDIQWEGKSPATEFPFARRFVNYGLLEMMDMKMAAGRSFSKDFSAEESKIIFNEAAINVMGLDNPVGKIIQYEEKNFELIGVVQNFHFESLHSNVDPLFFLLNPDQTQKVYAKIAPGMEQETIEQLEGFYQEFNPGFTFSYNFLDQAYESLYIAEDRVATLSKYFAIIAIVISCLGLFGLAAFTAERRQKEIGIRKILGATVYSVVTLLSRDFLLLVVSGFVIAVPVAWYLMHQWLTGFAYRIDIGLGIFGIAGGAALLIAILTVSWQSIKAALINPVKSLRSE